MSLWCDLTLALGLSLEACAPAAVKAEPLPAEDRGAWTYRPRKEPPAPEAPPAPPPAFPPVVIEKVVHMPAPASKPSPPPSAGPIPHPKSAGPDWTRLGMEASYDRRSQPVDGEWPSSVAVPIGQFEATADHDSVVPPIAIPASSSATPPKPAVGRYEEDARVSSLPVNNERVVTTDRYIAGTVESGINSQLVADDGGSGGEVVIQVSRDVFGYHGRNILIPKGSRLVCGYKSPKIGETRLAMRCGRILLGGSRAEILQASANVHDAQGRVGVTGEVDKRFWEKYGSAIVLAGISGAVRATAASVPTTDDGVNIVGEGAEELSERFGEITAAVLEETVHLNPIVTLSQGARIVIRPGRDWFIRRLGTSELPTNVAQQEKE